MKRKLLTSLFFMFLFAFALNAQTTTLYFTSSGGSYASERWIDITTGPDGTGTVLFAQGDGTYGNGSGDLADATFTVDDGTMYYINCYDAYDDSWNGGTYEIRSEAAGGGILVANNGGVTPDDGNDEDADGTWEDMDIERESSEGFSFTPPLGDDATIFAITNPVSGFPGGLSIEIFVDLMNVGINSFTACDINYDVYNVTTSTYLLQDETYSWTGDLALGGSENVNIGAFTSEYTTDYQITVTSVLAGDENADNDEYVADVSSESIYTLPYTEDYTAGYPPVFWTELEGLLADPTVFTPDDDNSAWYQDEFANVTDASTSMRLNIYGTLRDEWAFSPLIDLTGVTDASLSFDLALTDYGNSNAPEEVGDDDKFAIVISTDYGATWSSANVVQMWDNTSTPALVDVSTTGETVTIDLSAYSGVIQIGFYGESTVGSNGDNDLFIDNIRVGAPLAPTYTVTWNVDMTDSIASGYFVEGTDQLWVGGSMNGWTMPGDDAAFEMMESATDDIYTLNLSLEDGDYMYKYFKIVGGTSTWDLGEWTGDPNRAFTVAGADLVLNDLFGDKPESISDLTAKGISIYPNPSNGVFTVNVESNFNLDVFDITGKVIKTRTLTDNSTLELNTAGVYFLRFSNENGSVTQRVIVQ